MPGTIKVAVVYHSGYGHTVKVAEAVARGASSIAGVEVQLVKAEDAHLKWSLLDDADADADADAIIMGTPTYMGSLSAPFKAFMDATSQNAGPTKSRPALPPGRRVVATNRTRWCN
ncbi:MAG: flavodoxin family protein [Pseudomonas sp.]|nr:flavodoxin family protein [Pseudomonas sp.]